MAGVATLATARAHAALRPAASEPLSRAAISGQASTSSGVQEAHRGAQMAADDRSARERSRDSGGERRGGCRTPRDLLTSAPNVTPLPAGRGLSISLPGEGLSVQRAARQEGVLLD